MHCPERDEPSAVRGADELTKPRTIVMRGQFDLIRSALPDRTLAGAGGTGPTPTSVKPWSLSGPWRSDLSNAVCRSTIYTYADGGNTCAGNLIPLCPTAPPPQTRRRMAGRRRPVRNTPMDQPHRPPLRQPTQRPPHPPARTRIAAPHSAAPALPGTAWPRHRPARGLPAGVDGGIIPCAGTPSVVDDGPRMTREISCTTCLGSGPDMRDATRRKARPLLG
jgi:hypothetical protein